MTIQHQLHLAQMIILNIFIYESQTYMNNGSRPPSSGHFIITTKLFSRNRIYTTFWPFRGNIRFQIPMQNKLNTALSKRIKLFFLRLQYVSQYVLTKSLAKFDIIIIVITIALVVVRQRYLCLVHPGVRDKPWVSEIDLSQPRHETAFW